MVNVLQKVRFFWNGFRNMSTAPRPLDELREEIDTIDRQLHALIQQRGGLAADIAEIKKLESIDRVRPGREAVLLRALVERHEGEFPTGALLRMWREMISSLVLMEMPEYSVAVYAFGEDQACWDLARDQFGSRTPMTTHPSARDAISQVLTGKTSLAVVPSPTEEAPGNWWQNLRAAFDATPRSSDRPVFFHLERGFGPNWCCKPAP